MEGAGNAESRLEQLERRVYKLADVQAEHTLKLNEQGIVVTALEKSYALLNSSAATKEQLKFASDITHGKIDTIGEKVTTIQKSINWVVTLVLGGVAVAVLNLVLRGKLTP